MADFAACVGIASLLESWGIDPSQNFEDIYSGLHEAEETPKLNQLSKHVEEYFSRLELPDRPTIYDYLVLSLRETDIIASFNWDPLLLQAYQRNPTGLGKPRLAFLHGNILTGYCEVDHVSGLAGKACRRCGREFKSTTLLYPVRNKNYATDPAIASQWDLLKDGLKNAFMLTIFGYSGPKTDMEAITAMSGARGEATNRALEQTAFITKQSEEEVSRAWEKFIHTHHYEVQSDFFDSWIAKHPRRTGEAYLSQYIDAKFIAENPAPLSVDFDQLWAWYDKFRPAELDAGLT